MGVSRRVVLLVAAVLALAGGGIAAGILLTEGGSAGGQTKARYPYPQTVKNQLVAACTNHSEKSVCECVVRAYEATIPYDVYKQITRGGVRLNNKAFYQAFTQAASGCSS